MNYEVEAKVDEEQEVGNVEEDDEAVDGRKEDDRDEGDHDEGDHDELRRSHLVRE